MVRRSDGFEELLEPGQIAKAVEIRIVLDPLLVAVSVRDLDFAKEAIGAEVRGDVRMENLHRHRALARIPHGWRKLPASPGLV